MGLMLCQLHFKIIIVYNKRYKMSESKLNIVLPDLKNVTFGDLDLSVFEKYGNVIAYPLTKNEELAERLQDADVILCHKTLLSADTLKEASHLKYIGLFAT